MELCTLLSSGDPFWYSINIDFENSKLFKFFQRVIVF